MDHQFAVSAPAGDFIGKIENSGIAAFRGICYGITPRWQLAREPDRPSGLVNAAGTSIDTIQPGGVPENQREDMICLNVYLNPRYTGKRAVLAYVPVGGGVKSYGYGIDPSRFLQEHPEILVVVPNARVGVLSNLNLTEFEDAAEYGDLYRCSCNLTKMDFLHALRWIQTNIAAFGGDPENVTISGHSYGSVVTTSMFLIPEAEGLFQKAIPRSGYALDDCMLASWEESLYYAKKFREITGVNTIREALAIPTDRFLDIQGKLLRAIVPGKQYDDFPGSLAAPFSTVVDNVVIGSNYFDQLLRTAQRVKLLTGTTSGEKDNRYVGKSGEEILAAARQEFYSKLDPARGGTDGDEIIRSFIDSHGGDVALAGRELAADLGMRYGAIALGELFSVNSTAYVYYYDFYLDNEKKVRALHGAAERAAWGNPGSTPDFMALAIRSAFASFMVHGDPNVDNGAYALSGEPSYDTHSPWPEKLVWKPYTHETRYTMVYDNSGMRLTEGVKTGDADVVLRHMREYPLIVKRI